jgi:hypothetical protein
MPMAHVVLLALAAACYPTLSAIVLVLRMAFVLGHRVVKGVAAL